MDIRKNDAVQIIAGKDKGKTGQVIKVERSEGKIMVEGVNIVHRHMRPRTAQDKGGIVEQPALFDASNAMIICPSCHKKTRVAHTVIDGKKTRTCKHCGASLDVKAKAKATAKKAVKKTTKKKAAEEKPEAPVSAE